tara:strand:+ start:756 stop:869 length:114 start_codon:yes stop_codon:yes gene_type:complete
MAVDSILLKDGFQPFEDNHTAPVVFGRKLAPEKMLAL